MRTFEMKFRISQEMSSIINGMTSQIQRAISSTISERIFPKMQNVVENVLAGELRDVVTVFSGRHIQYDEMNNQNRNNIQNTDSLPEQNSIEPEEEGPHGKLFS